MVHQDKAIDRFREVVADAQRDLKLIESLASNVGETLDSGNVDIAKDMLQAISVLVRESDHDDFAAMFNHTVDATTHIENEKYALALEDCIEIKKTANELLDELEGD